MAKGMRKGGRKGGKGRGKGRKGRKANTNVPDIASLSVKRTLNGGTNQGFLPNTLYNAMSTSLKDFTRATQVGQAYQYYRIRRVALTFKPTFDTYGVKLDISGGSPPPAYTGLGKPNLYYMIDKSGSLPSNISLEGLKSLGARPKQLDEKNMTVSWVPSVLEASMTASGTAGSATSAPAKYMISPWLLTSANTVSPGVWIPSDVDHLGIYWYMDQFTGVGTAPQYNVEVEVQFEFKKPLTNLISNNVAISATYAEINHSADGVVGGNDGE